MSSATRCRRWCCRRGARRGSARPAWSARAGARGARRARSAGQLRTGEAPEEVVDSAGLAGEAADRWRGAAVPTGSAGVILGFGGRKATTRSVERVAHANPAALGSADRRAHPRTSSASRYVLGRRHFVLACPLRVSRTGLRRRRILQRGIRLCSRSPYCCRLHPPRRCSRHPPRSRCCYHRKRSRRCCSGRSLLEVVLSPN